jgi:hypothetical protein
MQKMVNPKQSYEDLNYTALVDLLAQETKKYTNALVQGSSDQELENYNYSIKLLSKEIEMRKKPVPSDFSPEDYSSEKINEISGDQ